MDAEATSTHKRSPAEEKGSDKKRATPRVSANKRAAKAPTETASQRKAREKGESQRTASDAVASVPAASRPPATPWILQKAFPPAPCTLTSLHGRLALNSYVLSSSLQVICCRSFPQLQAARSFPQSTRHHHRRLPSAVFLFLRVPWLWCLI